MKWPDKACPSVNGDWGGGVNQEDSPFIITNNIINDEQERINITEMQELVA